MKNTVQLHRVFAAPPERVYRAFVDGDAMSKWLPPNGFYCKVHEMDASEGGHYRMSFTNFTTGNAQFFGGKYVELKPSKFIKFIEKFEDPNLPGEMTTTVTLKEVSCGTDVEIVQSGIPDPIPTEMCYLGWQQSLFQLANLVEPNIPD